MGVGRHCKDRVVLDLRDRKLWEAGTGLLPASTWVHVEAGGTPSPRVTVLGVCPACQTETPPSQAEDPPGLTSRSSQVAVEGNVLLAHGQEICADIWNDRRACRKVPATVTLLPPCFCPERAVSTNCRNVHNGVSPMCLTAKIKYARPKALFNDPFFK